MARPRPPSWPARRPGSPGPPPFASIGGTPASPSILSLSSAVLGLVLVGLGDRIRGRPSGWAVLYRRPLLRSTFLAVALAWLTAAWAWPDPHPVTLSLALTASTLALAARQVPLRPIPELALASGLLAWVIGWGPPLSYWSDAPADSGPPRHALPRRRPGDRRGHPASSPGAEPGEARRVFGEAVPDFAIAAATIGVVLGCAGLFSGDFAALDGHAGARLRRLPRAGAGPAGGPAHPRRADDGLAGDRGRDAMGHRGPGRGDRRGVARAGRGGRRAAPLRAPVGRAPSGVRRERPRAPPRPRDRARRGRVRRRDRRERPHPRRLSDLGLRAAAPHPRAGPRRLDGPGRVDGLCVGRRGRGRGVPHALRTGAGPLGARQPPWAFSRASWPSSSGGSSGSRRGRPRPSGDEVFAIPLRNTTIALAVLAIGPGWGTVGPPLLASVPFLLLIKSRPSAGWLYPALGLVLASGTFAVLRPLGLRGPDALGDRRVVRVLVPRRGPPPREVAGLPSAGDSGRPRLRTPRLQCRRPARGSGDRRPARRGPRAGRAVVGEPLDTRGPGGPLAPDVPAVPGSPPGRRVRGAVEPGDDPARRPGPGLADGLGARGHAPRARLAAPGRGACRGPGTSPVACSGSSPAAWRMSSANGRSACSSRAPADGDPRRRGDPRADARRPGPLPRGLPRGLVGGARRDPAVRGEPGACRPGRRRRGAAARPARDGHAPAVVARLSPRRR